MAQVKRIQLQVYPLGGMDQRWRPMVQGGRLNTSAAELIEDMTWDEKGGWGHSGGYRVIRGDSTPGNSGNNISGVLPSLPGDPGNGSRPQGGYGGPND
jgi:hypothetical protein